jgi:hypothetical protein
METKEVSNCCKAELVEGYKDNPRDHHDPIAIYRCAKCKKECDVEDVCAECGGSGEVSTMEAVYAGEPHMAPIGSAICRNCYPPEDDFNDDEPF